MKRQARRKRQQDLRRSPRKESLHNGTNKLFSNADPASPEPSRQDILPSAEATSQQGRCVKVSETASLQGVSSELLTTDDSQDTLGKAQPATTSEAPFLSALLSDVLDKQYRNYNWNDTKMTALITSNSLLVAGIFAFLSTHSLETHVIFFSAFSLVCVSYSLILCVMHIIPRIQSGKSGPSNNVRTLSGITNFKNYFDYHQRVIVLTEGQLVEMTCRQIYGMACNNMRSYRILRHGSIVTIFGVIMMLASFFSYIWPLAQPIFYKHVNGTSSPASPPQPIAPDP